MQVLRPWPFPTPAVARLPLDDGLSSPAEDRLLAVSMPSARYGDRQQPLPDDATDCFLPHSAQHHKGRHRADLSNRLTSCSLSTGHSKLLPMIGRSLRVLLATTGVGRSDPIRSSRREVDRNDGRIGYALANGCRLFKGLSNGAWT